MLDTVELNCQTKKKPVNKAFNNVLWRDIVNQAAKELLPGEKDLSIISPWGFEVTNDKTYLSRQLRRFYCYIGVPTHLKTEINQSDLAKKFASILLAKLQAINPRFVSDIVILFEHNRLNLLKPVDYICQPTDKLLDVQIQFTDDILQDYADYVLTSVDAIASAKGEAIDYQHNPQTRWRMYQLYIMQENLFGYLLPSFNEQEYELYDSICTLLNNKIQIFYSMQGIQKEMTDKEKYLIDNLIIPRISLIKKAILDEEDKNNITIEKLSYHIENELQLRISKQNYAIFLDKIKTSYLNFM